MAQKPNYILFFNAQHLELMVLVMNWKTQEEYLEEKERYFSSHKSRHKAKLKVQMDINISLYLPQCLK